MPDPLPDAIARALWDAADLAIVVSSSRGIAYASQGYTRLTGFAADDLTGRTLASVTDPESRASLERALSQSIDGGAAEPHRVLLATSSGSATETEHTVRTIEIGGERLAVSTFTPVGERQRMADALVASERRYRDLFDEDTNGRFVATPDWQMLDCNATLARMLGCDEPSQLIGRTLFEFALDGPLLRKLIAVTRVERRAGLAELQLERVDGGVIDAVCTLAGSVNELGVLLSVRGQLTEITDTKLHETRLRGAERMEVIGRLAGGLAHDFNNLLMVISGNSDRLLEAMPDPGPLKSAAAAIHDASARATFLTRQLLAYGRRQVFSLEPLALQRLVADVQPSLAEILGDRIAMNLTIAPDLPSINADARQIEHVIANLAINAREAMPSGGTLTMAVDQTSIDESGRKARPWLRPGRYVRVVVSDSGHGMDAVTRAYAFQPFFTTKKMGEGRGLGLATVYGIVKQSHGFVWVDSEAGKGATFTLLFPAMKPGRTDVASGTSADEAETILVVEEDASARLFVCDSLRRRGYHVLDAANAAGALEMFASHPKRVHLLLSGSAAVAADGAPLAARLKAIDPMLQSLVMIDESQGETGSHRLLPTTPAIQKPFTLQALGAKVREVLDSGEGR